MSQEMNFKRKEDYESIQKIPIILIKFEEFNKRFENFESYTRNEFNQISSKIEKLESLRERIVEVETLSDMFKSKIVTLEEEFVKTTKENNLFLKRLTIELSITILGIVLTLIYILLKR